ncbi:MAG: hypothetical protein ABIU05_05030 [Nitrospirales bacterium]
MTRRAIALIGLFLLAGCSGGGGEPAATTQSVQGPSNGPAPRDLPGAPATAFLAATSEGLWRGDTSGKGGVVFVRPKLQQEDVVFGAGHVSYSVNDADIWTVNADGTGNRALVNSPQSEHVNAASGPWVIYFDSDIRTWQSVRADTGQQAVLSTTSDDEPYLLVGSRVIFSALSQLSSINFDGTDPRLHGPNYGYAWAFPIAAIAPSSFVYEQHPSPNQRLYAVSLTGDGQPIPLEDGLSRASYAGHFGTRVVYHRDGDVLSVNLDGTQTAVLAQQPENEAVQGIVGDKVVIRRNVSGNDQLVFVPIGGGAETFIMNLTDNDFVEVVAGNSLVLRRSTGTWRLDLNGALTKLGPTAGGHAYQVVGNAVSYNVSAALYCAPLDGSGPEVRIDRNGRIVGAL